MKTRMRFVKCGSMKFIGHLDCMRFFQKAIRRAKLDVAYSKGYSPHQLMSFASPLGVGVTSDGEYIDGLTSGSETNIKPELVMQAFYAFCENELEPYSYQIHRMQMIFKKKGE